MKNAFEIKMSKNKILCLENNEKIKKKKHAKNESLNTFFPFWNESFFRLFLRFFGTVLFTK